MLTSMLKIYTFYIFAENHLIRKIMWNVWKAGKKLVLFLSLKYKYSMNHQHLVTFSMLCSKKKYLNKKIIRWSVIVAQWVAELICLLLLRLLIIIITNHSIFCLFCSKLKLSFAIASKSKLMELTLLTKNHWYTWEVEWPFNKFASWS